MRDVSQQIALRPEASLIYVNADAVMETVLTRLWQVDPHELRLIVCDLSASPYMDLAGAQMLHRLHGELVGHKIRLRIIGAHGAVRELLRADGVESKVGRLDRTTTIETVLRADPQRP
jgi:MFS superfamily sulfate permease-like transporter